MSTITIPASVLIDGKWRAAHWKSHLNPYTGKIEYSVSVPDYKDIAFFITDDDLRELRKMAGESSAIQQPTRDAESRLRDLEKTLATVFLLLEGDALLRQQGDHENHRIVERLTTLAARCGELSTQVGKLQADHVTPADVQSDRDRLEALEIKAAAASVHLAQVPGAVNGIETLGKRLDGHLARLYLLETRIETAGRRIQALEDAR